jgi:hypothetical protein
VDEASSSSISLELLEGELAEALEVVVLIEVAVGPFVSFGFGPSLP